MHLKQSYGSEIELVGEYVDAITPTQFINTISDISFKSTPNNVLTGKSLGRKISNGEFEVKQYLEANDIEHIFQYKIEDLSRLSFDFYLPDHNLIIEYDGEQHFEPIKYFGANKFERQQVNDEKKNEYCSVNNINLLRIPYWEREVIDTILEDALF